LTAQGSQTEVQWNGLSPSERLALDALSKKYSVDTSAKEGKVLVNKPIGKVENLLAQATKKGRKLLSAVVFQSGRIEELYRTGEEKGDTVLPYRTAEPVKEPAKAAVTVAEPTLSCPVPAFEQANIRATRVLRAFLTPQQLGDFGKREQFFVTGVDSGHGYILTSRQASPERLAKVGGRSVYDVTRRMAVCVHDWTVPAAEELLELALFLQMPGREWHVSRLAFEPLV
jgi:hypothetical protein